MVQNPENWPWKIIWKLELPALLRLQSLVLVLLMTIHDACFTWVLLLAVDAYYMKKLVNQLITYFSIVISPDSLWYVFPGIFGIQLIMPNRP